MQPLNDIELIKKIKNNGCEKSLLEIIKRHKNLYFKMFHYYENILKQKQIDYKEVAENATFNIYQAILLFKEDRNVKFSTWLANYTRYKCLHLINKKPNIISLDIEDINEEVKKRGFVPDNRESEFNNLILSSINEIEDKRIQNIINIRFFRQDNKNTSWSSIGKEMGLSTQTIINLFKKGQKILTKKLTKHKKELR